MHQHTATGYHTRWAIRRDLPDMLEIHNKNYSTVLTEDRLIDYLRCRNTIGIVVEDEKGSVRGWTLYQLHPQQIQCLFLLTHPDFAGRGFATTLMDRLKGKLHTGKRTRLLIPVRASNIEACQWLHKKGFRAAEISKTWFTEPKESAIVMRWQLLPNGKTA